MALDPVGLAQDLIRCPSVTPVDAGALDRLQRVLEGLGFRCERLPFSEIGTPDVDNLYARFGDSGRNFCFAGHTDVVPTGDLKGWSIDPFAAEIVDGVLYGRGAADMKSAIAAFVVATERFVKGRGGFGSISLLITGDEEGPSINGTKKVVEWLKSRGEKVDACVVGEPTNPKRLGEMMKIGRRGSLNGRLTVIGAQGHVAYPHLADNPMPRLLKMLTAITGRKLDKGNDWFQPSNLEVVTIDVGNKATNVIPAKATAGFNIRFNDMHSGAKLTEWLRNAFDAVGGAYELDIQISGESFITEPGPLSDLVGEAARSVTGIDPDRSTTGGTSDARFIRHICPVVEFGLVGETMHKVDERARIEDIHALTDIYGRVLDGYFRA
ncbi:MAG: succinyl-diaminopimelate desuccinylase [Alphaproteobacteria bacterium]|nr:succinyl-diaminopimelate desuccinylase [Alphaproteobacteria bacterium]